MCGILEQTFITCVSWQGLFFLIAFVFYYQKVADQQVENRSKEQRYDCTSQCDDIVGHTEIGRRQTCQQNFSVYCCIMCGLAATTGDLFVSASVNSANIDCIFSTCLNLLVTKSSPLAAALSSPGDKVVVITAGLHPRNLSSIWQTLLITNHQFSVLLTQHQIHG